MTSVYEKIIRYIDEHIKDEITLGDISKLAGYSPPHIYKIFKYYTSMPIMEYIRRKKLYSAANEFYTGRKLFDIALDYGYETPAGFYKAFQSVFSCSPREYKQKNKIRSDINMNIEQVKTVEELKECLELFKQLYPMIPVWDIEPWIERLKTQPEFLLYAKDGDKICAITFGILGDNNWVTVDEGCLADYWNTGIFEALFVELEKRAKKFECTGIGLGIGEDQEDFYAKLGFTGSMLIQSDKHSIEELLKVIEGEDYEVNLTRIHDGYINQIWLRVSLLDKELKRRYEQDLGNCWTQIIVSKGL